MKLHTSLLAQAALSAMLAASPATVAASPPPADHASPLLADIYIGVQQRGPKPGANVYFAPSRHGTACRTAWLSPASDSPCGRRFDAHAPDGGRVERGLTLEGCDAAAAANTGGGGDSGVWLSQGGRRVAACVRDATPRAGCPQIHGTYVCRGVK